MKKIKLILPLLVLSLFSCDNYLDINDNPNDLLASETQPDKYLPAAQVGCYRVQATTMNRLGLLFSNATAGNVSTYAAPFQDEFNLNISTNFYSAIFENLYLNVNTFQQIIDYQDATGKYAAYKVAAKICKAHYMQYLVDLYGDVPYTEAFKASEFLTPKYNDDQVVYKELMNELDEARALIVDINNGVYGTYDATASGMNAADVMLHGDLAKWNRFANTIELRMLVRMSNNTGAVAAWRDLRLAALIGKPFVTEDVKINPGYSSATDAQVNPVVFTFGWNAAGNATGFNQYILSGHFLKSLNPYSDVNYSSPAEQEVIPGTGVFYPDVIDSRRFNLFSRAVNTPATPYHKGVTQGSTVVDVFKPGGTVGGQPSKFAVKFFNPYNESGSTVPGNAQAGVSGYVMTLSESLFLQAEAALLGETQGGYAVLGLNAATNFDSGVSKSFDFYQTTGAAAYLAIINTKPNFGYNPAFTYQQRYHAIMYQKWIALLNSNAVESYIDNTRTGYPVTPLSLGAGKPNRPKRLIYPNSEYTSNAANVPNVTISDVFTVNATSPFWLQGDPALGN